LENEYRAEPEPAIEPMSMHIWHDVIFELPIDGATGFSSIPLEVYTEADKNSGIVLTLAVGRGFTILNEQENWWHIRIDEAVGFVCHATCFINLPDVLPSIIYKITNAQESVMRSAGIEIPNITGEALYEAMQYNPRFGRDEFTVPVLYSTAQKLAAAQKAALAEGYSIIVYEAFRPRETQLRVSENLRSLVGSNREVSDALAGWEIRSFIASSVSNHQRGGAIDASLASVLSQESGKSGEFSFIRITEYEEHAMPSPIHELSARSIIFKQYVDTSSDTAWRTAELANTATEGAKLLQNYLTDAGFTPIASEWWHFNDLPSLRLIKHHGASGEFDMPSNFSVPPN
jgi:D-alanyl-D-alanine dipeptidase